MMVWGNKLIDNFPLVIALTIFLIIIIRDFNPQNFLVCGPRKKQEKIGGLKIPLLESRTLVVTYSISTEYTVSLQGGKWH